MKKIILIGVIIILVLRLGFVDDHKLTEAGLTESEILWLIDNQPIRVAPENSSPPLEFKEDGVFKGIAIDQMEWISNHYGIEFEYLEYDTWSDILQGIKDNEVDLEIAIVETGDRGDYINFTAPFNITESALLVRSDYDDSDLVFEDVLRKRIGVIEDYSVIDFLELKYNYFDYKEYPDFAALVNAMEVNEIDGILSDLSQLSYYIKSWDLIGYKLADVEIDFKYRLAIGSSMEKAPIGPIYYKLFETIPKNVIDEINGTWIDIGSYENISKEVINIVLIVVLLIISLAVGIVLWSISLKQLVDKKRNELENLNANLESLVIEKSESIVSLNDKLVESKRLNGLNRLVVGISKEILVPLKYSKNRCQSMLNLIEEQGGDQGQLSKTINTINMDISKISKMLTDFTQVSSQSRFFNKTKMNMAELIEETVSSIIEKRGFNNLELDLNLDSRIQVYTEIISLKNLVEELVENAYCHGYNSQRGTLEISLASDGDKIILVFRDHGCGIKKENINSVYEPFFTTERGSTSTGLGLYYVYNIVYGVLQGEMFVKSSEDLGTTIRIEMSQRVMTW